MTYGNYMGQNGYYPYQQMNQYPNHFVNAMQQNYGLPQQQVQVQPQAQQQNITTQPPIMQPQASVGSKIIPVANKEEATGTAVDLVNGTPSFFYNKSNGEIYLKQFDIPTGKGIFKTYIEAQISEKPTKEVYDPSVIEQKIDYLKEGIAGLYRKLEQMNQPVYIKQANVEELEMEEPKPQKGKKNA